jgi:hypothetical protein
VVSRTLRFTKAELSNAAKLCLEHGVHVKLGRDGSILVFHDNHRVAAVDDLIADDLDAEWAAFEAKHGDG